MKRRILLRFISVIGGLFSFSIVDVYGNGVPTPNVIKSPYGTIIMLVILFVIAVGFEFLVFTQKAFDLAPRNTRLLISFLKINLITFPLTQILAYIVYLYIPVYYWIFVLGIEILVVLTEWRLILMEFDRKYDRILPSKRVLGMSLRINMISFFLGVLPYLVILLLTGYPYY